MSARITLKRREVVSRILAERGEALVITGLGSTSWDAAAAGDHPLNFYTWGGMGGAAMLGLGVALAQPDRRVLVITGDGEMLMGMGSLATIGVAGPQNLAVVVIDNERYGETGQQATHTHYGVDLPGVAAASGFAHTATVYAAKALSRAIGELYALPGPIFTSIKVEAGSEPLVLPDRDGTYLKSRFRSALIGAND